MSRHLSMDRSERRYLILLLVFVGINVILTAGVIAAFVTYSQLKEIDEKNSFISGQARHLAVIALEGSIEDFYQRNIPALNLRLNAAVEQTTHEVRGLDMCINLHMSREGFGDPVDLASCSAKIESLEDLQVYNETRHQLKIGDVSLADYQIRTFLVMPKGIPLNVILFSMILIIIQLPIFGAINYFNIYGRLIKPLLSDFRSKNVALKKSLALIEQERKISNSMHRLSNRLSNSPSREAEAIYLSELQHQETFPESIIVTKNRTYFHRKLADIADNMLALYPQVVAKIDEVELVNLIDLENPTSAFDRGIGVLLESAVPRSAYIVFFSLIRTDQFAWMYIPKSEVCYFEENSLVKKYFSHLSQQFADYQQFRMHIGEETLEIFKALTRRDGYVPISDETVYVEYSHPEALIYDNKGIERKVRISLFKLLQLFPEHLIQISKSFLINPKHADDGDFNDNMGFIRVKIKNRIVRLKSSATFIEKIRGGYYDK